MTPPSLSPVPSASESSERIRHPLLLARLVHTRAFRAAHDCDDTRHMISGVRYADDEPVTIQFYFPAHFHLPFTISTLLTCVILLLYVVSATGSGCR